MAEKPMAVKVLGSVYAALGALCMVGGAAALLMSAGLPDDAIESAPRPGGSQIAWLFRHFEIVGVAQVALGLLMLVAGVCLLRLHAWARTVLVAVTCLGLAYVLASGAHWLIVWFVTTSDQPPRVALAVAIAGAALIAFYAAIAGVLIHFLRSETVRRAVRGDRDEPAAG